jgi:REP element-mobilizing transposase RayT
VTLKTPKQRSLPRTHGHGGRREGAGRPRSGRRVGVPHRPRADHKARHPVHATLRVREGLPSLRTDRAIWQAARAALARASSPAFRVVHFSVQSNHLHLVVEAHDNEALSRGMQGLSIRLARAVNRALGARGSVFADRYHAHELRTPREVRNALCYVLQNWRKHGLGGDWDPRSSAAWFDGWAVPPPPSPEPPITAAPRTWLITVGWRRCGLLRPGERPGSLARVPA